MCYSTFECGDVIEIQVVTKTRDGTGQRRDVPSRPGY